MCRLDGETPQEAEYRKATRDLARGLGDLDTSERNQGRPGISGWPWFTTTKEHPMCGDDPDKKYHSDDKPDPGPDGPIGFGGFVAMVRTGIRLLFGRLA
jgi:hypothetical protein